MDPLMRSYYENEEAAKQKRIFILEDDPFRIRQFCEALLHCDVTIRTNVEAAKAAWNPPYDVVSLDHDLGGETYVDSSHENTGYQFTKWLCQEPRDVKKYYVHSYNPDGATNMLHELLKADVVVYRIPFGPTLLRELM